jgi:hypothetical protein
MYTQCVLRRGNVEQVAFIPSEFAKKGNFVKIEESGIWTNGWKVISVGQVVEKPIYSEKAIRQHRKNTGDSLPKGNRKC